MKVSPSFWKIRFQINTISIFRKAKISPSRRVVVTAAPHSDDPPSVSRKKACVTVKQMIHSPPNHCSRAGSFYCTPLGGNHGETNMKRAARWISLALTLSAFAFPTSAASKSGWDGTWSGMWGGSQATSITIEDNKVVSFEYQGATTPVTSSRVTPTKVTYGDNGVIVTMTKTGASSALATIHSPQGDATAKMTRQ
jgi:hypothetical protein